MEQIARIKGIGGGGFGAPPEPQRKDIAGPEPKRQPKKEDKPKKDEEKNA